MTICDLFVTSCDLFETSCDLVETFCDLFQTFCELFETFRDSFETFCDLLERFCVRWKSICDELKIYDCVETWRDADLTLNSNSSDISHGSGKLKKCWKYVQLEWRQREKCEKFWRYRKC